MTEQHRIFVRYISSNSDNPFIDPKDVSGHHWPTTTYRGKIVRESAISYGEVVPNQKLTSKTLRVKPILGLVFPQNNLRTRHYASHGPIYKGRHIFTYSPEEMDYRDVEKAEMFLAPANGTNPNSAFARTFEKHAQQEGVEVAKHPILFSKGCLCTPSGQPFTIPSRHHTKVHGLNVNVDYEAELAAVIGVRIRKRTSASKIREMILKGWIGFTVVNDISERSRQFENGGQWFLGKSPEGGFPMATPLIFGLYPDNWIIRCRVNGKLKQKDSTSSLSFKVEELIAFCARDNDLYPGTVITFGSPDGHGLGRLLTEIKRKPKISPREIAEIAKKYSLHAGDEVVCEITIPELGKITVETSIVA